MAALEIALRCNPKSIELLPGLVPDATVKFKSGPMKGVEGIVTDADNKEEALARRDGRDPRRPGGCLLVTPRLQMRNL